MKDVLRQLIAIADEPTDDDDRRLRKRVGVVAGYLTIIAPLTLPIQAQGHPLSWPLALAEGVLEGLGERRLQAVLD